jgi:serine/threonine protein phosphatase 1
MRTLAIGDMHGCLRALDTLLQQVALQPDDVVITLGDYVDRGPDSRGVLDRLLSLRDHCRWIHLKGNHDLMMLAAHDDAEEFSEWVKSGGKQTLQSYAAPQEWPSFVDAVPAEHWRLLGEECVPFYETKSHFFVHANVYPDVPLSEQPDYMLYWEKLEPAVWSPHESGKTMICGHSSQRSGRPLTLENAICIDTRVYDEGWLTCLDVAMELYWQANERGETRIGNLRFRRR